MVDATMTIPEPYATQIIKWASLGRTIDAARNTLEECLELTEDFSDLEEMINHVIDELDSVKPFANFLHHEARQAIYKARKNEASS
jgi:hypothetical protein